MILITAHSLAEVIAERDFDRRNGTLIDSKITSGLSWVDYTTFSGEVVRLEYDADAQAWGPK